MTNVLVATTRHFVGQAADGKPTDSPAGSIFQETDTGKLFVYTGAAWVWQPTLATLQAGEAHLGSVGGAGVSVTATFTRPADATAYAALDAVSNSTSAPAVLTFTGAARVTGGSGYIAKAQLLTDLKTDVKAYRLHLFNAAPTAINDNSPYLQLYANAAARVGTIDFPPLATEDPTNSTAAGGQNTQTGLPLVFVCAADANLYGILETLSAGTPASGQSYTIKLGIDAN